MATSLQGLTQSLALEGRPLGVAVGVVHPGNIHSDLLTPKDIAARQTEGFVSVENVADVVLTSLLATLLTFDCEPLQGRPNLAKVSGKDARACTWVGG